VVATVENVGDEAGTQSVALFVGEGPDPADQTEVDLESDETSEILLSATTADLEAGSYTVTVETEDESDSVTVSLEEPPESDEAPAEGEAPAVGEAARRQRRVKRQRLVRLSQRPTLNPRARPK